MLSTNQVADKPEEFKLVTVTIAAASDTTANTADVELIWGKILWVYPTSVNDPDQFIQTATLSATGVVTIILVANSTAEAIYTVAIARATGNDA